MPTARTTQHRCLTAATVAVLAGVVLFPASSTGAATGDEGTACVWGRAWHDEDDSATRDEGEPGARGVIVELLDATAKPGDEIVAETATGPAGDYRFTHLPAGTYRVRVTVTDPVTIVAADVGTDDDADSEPDPTTGETVDLTLADGDIAAAIDVGLANGTGDPAPGIGDRVWDDEDEDGLQGACESGVEGVTLDLLDTVDSVVATESTDDQGHYFFADPGPGSYRVRISLPADAVLTAARVGDAALDSDFDTMNRTTDAIAYVAGEHRDDIDAGLVITEPSPTITTNPPSSSTPPTTDAPAACEDACVPPTTAPTTISVPVADLPLTGCGPDEIDDPQTGRCVPVAVTTLPLTREQSLAAYAASLGAGTLAIDECEAAEEANADDLDIRCEGLTVGDDFRLRITVSRSDAGSSSRDGSTTTGPTDTRGGVVITTGFETRVRLTFDPDDLEVTALDGELLSEREAAVVVQVLEGGSADAVFVVTPRRSGERSARLDLLALGEDGQALPVAAGDIVFAIAEPVVASPPAAPSTGGGPADAADAEIVNLTAAGSDAGSSNTIVFVTVLGLLVAALGTGGFVWNRRRAAATATIPAAVSSRAAPLATAAAAEHAGVFVSYARRDTARVVPLIEAINRAGIPTWVDKRSIDGGENWKEEIVRGIRNSDGIVLVLSNASVESDYVEAEVSVAKSSKKPILPVRLHKDLGLSDTLTLDLANIHYVDHLDDSEESLNAVVETLRRLLESEDD